jgi:hypothetical protein
MQRSHSAKASPRNEVERGELDPRFIRSSSEGNGKANHATYGQVPAYAALAVPVADCPPLMWRRATVNGRQSAER